MYYQSISPIVRMGMPLLLAVILCTSCEKKTTGTGHPEDPEKAASFIPEENKKYMYTIENDGGSGSTAMQYISGSRDSSGIAVYNLHTVIEASGTSMTTDNNLFTLAGKTCTEIKVPDAWYQYVALFDQMPNIKVTKTEVFGYPAYMTMENTLKDGSIVTTDGPLQQGQRIEFTNNGVPCFMLQEILQVAGTAKVETVTVPAGSFVCNRFSYEVNTKITVKNGATQETANGNEKITIWMSHGIGMVKQQSAASLVSLVPLPTGEIKKIVTNTASTTTLQKIE